MEVTEQHISNFSRKSFKELAAIQDTPCVSICLPCTKLHPKANLIRLKQLFSEAEAQFISMGRTPSEAAALFNPARVLLNDLAVWQHQYNSLILFLTPHHFFAYHIPLDIKEYVEVDNQFHIKPLLKFLMHGSMYYLLDLNLQHIRLFQGTASRFSELSLSGAAQYIDEYIDDGAHTSEQLSTFLRQVDRAVTKRLAGESAPLVIAGTASHQQLYKRISHYWNLYDVNVNAHDEASLFPAIHNKSWMQLLPHFQQSKTEAINIFNYFLEAAPEHTAVGIEAVIQAMQNQQIHNLFIGNLEPIWGTYTNHGELLIHTKREMGDIDLLDEAAKKTLQDDGNIFHVNQNQIANTASIAALLSG